MNKNILRIISMLICSVMIISVIQSGVIAVDNKSDNYYEEPNTEEYESLSFSEEVTGGETDYGFDEDEYSVPDSFRSAGTTSGETVDVTDDNIVQRFVPVITGNTVTDMLQNLSSENLYTFTVDKRGVLSYSFAHGTMTDISYNWKISLYQKFNPDGNENNVKYREIYTEYSTNTNDSFSTLGIGVYPGEYRISVKCLSGSENAQYSFCVNFARSDYYECECNDTLSRYNELTLGKTVIGSGAKLINGNDRDCFMFEITEKGYINLAFLHDELSTTNAAYRIYIYDAKGKEYYYAVSQMDDIIVSSGNVALEPGFYFVEIDMHIFCNTEYRLSVQFTTDGMYETESNDTFKTADEIISGIEIYGNLSKRSDYKDKDRYKFTVGENSSVVIDFIHKDLSRTLNGWNILLYSENGELMYSTVSKWNDTVIQSPFIGLPAGTYYIDINSDELYLSSVTYALLVINTTEGVWESEKNDTVATANDIEINTDINGTLTENGTDYDVDYYKFTMTRKKEIEIDFVHPLTDYDREGWIISLIDEKGNIVQSFTSNWSKQKTSGEKITLEEGTYYIKVDTGEYYSHMKYSLCVNMDKKTDIDIGVDPV